MQSAITRSKACNSRATRTRAVMMTLSRMYRDWHVKCVLFQGTPSRCQRLSSSTNHTHYEAASFSHSPCGGAAASSCNGRLLYQHQHTPPTTDTVDGEVSQRQVLVSSPSLTPEKRLVVGPCETPAIHKCTPGSSSRLKVHGASPHGARKTVVFAHRNGTSI